jgi:hypothetical protein
MRIVPRVAVVLLAVSIPAGAAAQTKPKPSARVCRPARSTRCLRRARGAEPVIVSPAGRISRAEALQAFVQTVGPLPGIKVQPGAVAPRASHSASGPLRWAASFLPSMTKGQRSAFRALISLHPPGRRAHLAAVPPKATTQTWTKAGDTALQRLGQHLGLPLGLPLVVKLMTVNDATDPSTYADSSPVTKNGSWAPMPVKGVSCRIRVYPVAWQNHEPDLPISIMAHELVHCFQYKLNPKLYGTSTETWLQEGGAEWGGDQVAAEVLGHDPNDSLLHGYWDVYLSSPQIELLTRTYTAVGFFAHLAETEPGNNLWPTLKQMIEAKNGVDAYDIAAPDKNTAFLDSWASSYARTPSLGAGWDTSGVGITAEKLAVATDGGSSVTLSAGPRANALVKLPISGQVLEVTNGGGVAFGRVRDSGGTTDSVDSAAYCVAGATCTCPDGTPGAGEELPPIAGGIAWAAVTGNIQATQVTFTRTTTATWCERPVGGSPRTGSSALTVGGAATGSSFDHGANDSCTIHQQSTFPPGAQLQCFFEIAEPGTSAIAQLSFSTFHYTGLGSYEVTGRGYTTGPDVDFTDLTGTWAATEMPMDSEAGSFAISAINGGLITGSIGATMEDVTAPEQSAGMVSAGGSFTVPLQTAP